MLFLLFVPVLTLAQPPDEKENPTHAKHPERQDETTPRPGPVFRVSVTAPPVVAANPVDRYANRTALVTYQQIEDLGAWDLASALRRVPGVVNGRYNLVGSYGGADGGAVYVRGQGSGRPGAEIVTLFDGIPRFVGVWTHPLLDTVSLSGADAIEVYKSPQPVQLGNMSFAAVDVKPGLREAEGFHGRIQTAGGGHASYLQRIELYGGRGRTLFSLAGTYRESEGHRPRAGGQALDLNGRLRVRLSDSFFADLQFAHAGGWAEDPGRTDTPPAPLAERFTADSDLVIAGLHHSGDRYEGSARFYLDNGDIDWRQWSRPGSTPFYTQTESANYGIRLRETVRAWERSELIIGFDHDSYGGRSVERRPSDKHELVDKRFANTSPYVLFSREFGSSVVLTPSAGFRLNHSRFFGKDWGGQVGLTAATGQTTFYANWSRGYNLPGVYVVGLYRQWGRGDQWRELAPEVVRHAEGGVSWAPRSWVRLDFSLFQDNVSDAIRFVPPPPAPVFSNIGSYRTRGVEASVSVFPWTHLALFSAVTQMTAAGARSTSRGRISSAVPNLPRWTWVSGLTYAPGARWRLNLDAQWLDRQLVLNPRYQTVWTAWVDSYFLTNGRLSYLARPGGSRLVVEIFGAVENLADQAYELRPGYPMPGRTCVAGASWGF